MNRDEIREIAIATHESMHVMNEAMLKQAEEMITRAMEMSVSGRLHAGLTYKFTAAEVRDLLRARAEKLRTEASADEGNVGKLVDEAMASGMIYSPPGVRAGFGPEPDPDPKLRARCEEGVIGEIRAKREQADRFDWQASHLVEKEYVLGAHDLEELRPTAHSLVGRRVIV